MIQSSSGDISTYFMNATQESCKTNSSSNKILNVSTFTVITPQLPLQVSLNWRDMYWFLY